MVSGCLESSVWEAHRYGAWVVVLEPTETADGLRSRICLDCGRCDEESFKKTESGHIHSYGEWITNSYSHYKKCDCGERAYEAAHTKSNWIVDKPAAAEETGSKHKECTVCGRVLERETIPATGADHVHNYEEIKVDADNHWKECNCGVKGEMGAHTFVWITDKEATKTETGLKHEACSVCGAKRNENTVIAKLSDGGNTGSGGSGQPSDPDSPQTGDTASLIGWMAALFVSGNILTVLGITSKKKKEETEA